MFFKCENCGGNIVYNPGKSVMCCPHCDGIDSERKMLNTGDMHQCINCGAPMDGAIKEHTSATKCPSCGIYTILEPRIEGGYEPDRILPFRIGREEAGSLLKAEFSKRLFTPLNFLNRASIEKMEGTYVPFFMYDYHAQGSFHGEGTKVRTWSDSSYRYTETSYYRIDREIEANYADVPVDASVAMDDGLMDLLEPYKYEGMENFDPKYMSGFMAEKYSEDSSDLEPRAGKKVRQSMHSIVTGTITGYNTTTNSTVVNAQKRAVRYALLPVWEYIYRSGGKEYKFHVNGQTGKVIGKTPVDKGMVMLYGATVFGLVTIIAEAVRVIMMSI